MLKKEFSEVLKQIIYFVLVMILLPIPLLILKLLPDQSYSDILFSVYHFGLLFLALFMGASLFSFDRDQRGLEYLLSLPYSRLRILGMKILPRVITIVIFYLIYLISYKANPESYSIYFFIFFTSAYFFLFLIALSLSASSDNFLVLSITSLGLLFLYLGLLYLLFWVVLLIKGIPLYGYRYIMELGPRSFTFELIPLIALIIALPFFVSFVLSFKKFDIRPARVYNKRYFKYFPPLLALGLIISTLISYLGTGIGYKTYYLTHDHKLIEFRYPSIKIYEKDKVHAVKGEFESYWAHLDENEYVYDMYGREVSRLNTSDHTGEILYKVPYKKRVTWQSWKYGQTIILLEKEKNIPGIQLVLLDESSKKIKKIPFNHVSLKDYYLPIVFGTDQTDGKRFWLLCSERAWKSPILRVWEDGKTENIGTSQKRPCYVNQMLITYTDQAMIISQDIEGRFESIREIPEGKDWKFIMGYIRPNLNNIPIKELYGRKDRKIGRFDLETLEIEEIGESKGYIQYSYPDDFYLVEIDIAATLIKIHHLKDGQIKLLRSFQDFDTRAKENRFSMDKGGVVLKKGKKVEVYAFPDLKELDFKKLS